MPIKNPSMSHEFCNYEGEISFFIRCWWRLEHGNSVVVSSTDEENKIVHGLNHLTGKMIENATAIEPAWDLVLYFSNHWTLRTFSNQTDSADKLLKNWHSRIYDQRIYAGPGARFEIVTGKGCKSRYLNKPNQLSRNHE